MDKKRSDMGGTTMVVSVDKFKHTPPPIKHSESDYQERLYEKLLKKHGQFNLIKICSVNKELRIIDGFKVFEALKKAGAKKVKCFYFGEIENIEYVSLRLLFNYDFQRLDFIGISENLNENANNKTDIQNVSIKTGIKVKDVERYIELLRFDWDAFNKKTIEKNKQVNIFDIIGDE